MRLDCKREESICKFHPNKVKCHCFQIKWCNQLFEEAVPIVCQLVTETLLTLDPPIPRVMEAYLQDKDDPLNILIQLKQVSSKIKFLCLKADPSEFCGQGIIWGGCG